MDTFRGTANSTLLRSTLYSKNRGSVDENHNGLLRVDSPISGNLLVATASTIKATKDPISGTVLKHKKNEATVTTPADIQQLIYSRHFYIHRDVDITLQTLRNTTRVNKYTNEKVGTAGTPTGVDKNLIAFQEAQKQHQLQQSRAPTAQNATL